MKSASLYTVQAAKLLRIRRRRHRAQETLWVRHRVPVAIEQPSDTEFPLAIRTTSPRRSEYRSYRGRIFAPDRVLGMRSAPEFPIEFITNAFEGRLPASSWQNPKYPPLDFYQTIPTRAGFNGNRPRGDGEGF